MVANRNCKWLMLLTAFLGCDLTDKSQNVVITEEVVYVSSEKARFTGRIIESRGTIAAHGVGVSQSENFENFMVVDNGPIDELGLLNLF